MSEAVFVHDTQRVYPAGRLDLAEADSDSQRIGKVIYLLPLPFKVLYDQTEMYRVMKYVARDEMLSMRLGRLFCDI